MKQCYFGRAGWLFAICLVFGLPPRGGPLGGPLSGALVGPPPLSGPPHGGRFGFLVTIKCLVTRSL